MPADWGYLHSSTDWIFEPPKIHLGSLAEMYDTCQAEASSNMRVMPQKLCDIVKTYYVSELFLSCTRLWWIWRWGNTNNNWNYEVSWQLSGRVDGNVFKLQIPRKFHKFTQKGVLHAVEQMRKIHVDNFRKQNLINRTMMSFPFWGTFMTSLDLPLFLTN